MLTKNVYLLYPVGYLGDYVNWSICISDQDLVKQSVSNPRLQVSLPIHQSIHSHVAWMIKNRPETPKIYQLKVDSSTAPTATVYNTISQILQYDPDPVLIYINDADELDVQCYGLLNSIINYPECIYYENYNINWSTCGNDLTVRNLIANGTVNLSANPMNKMFNDRIENNILRYCQWFNRLHEYFPNEVNENYYVINKKMPKIHELSCRDVVSVHYPEILDSIMSQSNCSSNYSTEHVSNFHSNYIQSQYNTQWFDSIKHWRATGVLDQFLNSHSVIQGLVIRNIFKIYNHNVVDSNKDKWKILYNSVKDSSWPTSVAEEDFYLLPRHIQEELTTVFGYVVPTEHHNNLIGWEAMSLNEINEIYQPLR